MDAVEMAPPERGNALMEQDEHRQLRLFQELALKEETAEGTGRREAGDLFHLLSDDANFTLQSGAPRIWSDEAVVDLLASGGSDRDGWHLRRYRIEGGPRGGRLVGSEAHVHSGRGPEWRAFACDLSRGEFRAVLRVVEAAASVEAARGDELSWDPCNGPVQQMVILDRLRVHGTQGEYLDECRTPALDVAEDWKRVRVTAVYRLALRISLDASRPWRGLSPDDRAGLRASYLQDAPAGEAWFHRLHSILFRGLGEDEGLREADRRRSDAAKR